MEKERLENRQRTFRKFYESKDSWPEPTYFKKVYDQAQKQDNWVYKGTYFEEDRKTQSWDRCPDLYSDQFADEVKPYIVQWQ